MKLYDIGTKFRPVGKDYECTVTDILTTKNIAGETVKIRYVATHKFLGKMVNDYDVVHATISQGLA